jgi:hypothetical protein
VMDVSVIIPTYNRAAMLGEAIESALAQTRLPGEIIVVDDGSTDDTAKVMGGFAHRVRCITQVNRGVAAARNVGLAAAKGELIAFLDSDDLWYPFKLELQVALFERMPSVSLVCSEFDVLKDDGTKRPEGSRSWLAQPVDLASFYPATTTSDAIGMELPPGLAAFPIYHGWIYRTLLDEALVLTSTAVVKRSALGPTDRFTEGVSIFEDWEFFARIARGHAAAFMDIATIANRGHHTPGRLTGCSRLAKAQGYLGLVERTWKADEQFVRQCKSEVERAEAHACLAVACEAILASRSDIARASLARWSAIDDRSRSGWAGVYGMCARLPAGRVLLRQVIRARTLVRIIGRSPRRGYSVNPAG